MAEERLSVLVVDDSEQVRSSIRAMLDLEEGFLVVGEAGDGQQAQELAATLRPDVVLMDINMPRVSGITATQAIVRELGVPVVIISVQGEPEYLRRAMQAGARDYLIKPFSCHELVKALRSATAQPSPIAPAPERPHGQILTVFSAKGGTGKSMLSVNLAASLAIKTRLRVAVVDLDLEFGSVSSLFGLRPTASILDLCRVPGRLEPQHLDKVMLQAAPVPVDVLAAPPQPHLAAEVVGEARADRSRNYVAEILDLLQQCYDFTVVDTGTGFGEANLAALDRSDRIFLVTAPEVPTLENTAKALGILLSRLEYPVAKVDLVVNLVGDGALPAPEVEKALGHPIAGLLPVERNLANAAANAGQPFMMRRSQTPLTTAVAAMAGRVLRPEPGAATAAPAAQAVRGGALFALRSLVGGSLPARPRAGAV